VGHQLADIPSAEQLIGRTEAEVWHLFDTEGPLLVQELLDAQAEYRIVVVGDQVVRVIKHFAEPPLFRPVNGEESRFARFAALPRAAGTDIAEIDVVETPDGRLAVVDVNPVLNLGFWRRFGQGIDPIDHVAKYLHLALEKFP
jgi:glutathione synthase/RimK-type ligase-like ATP-grasp enzyme